MWIYGTSLGSRACSLGHETVEPIQQGPLDTRPLGQQGSQGARAGPADRGSGRRGRGSSRWR